MKTLEEYMKLPYKMEIIPDDSEGGYAACFPELQGCAAEGNSFEDVIAKVIAAKEEWFKEAIAKDREIPEPGARK
ncbi:MAG: type II toxin-antitoxin system HicB family antitoxin [Ruminococcus sp.]|nr:type II toxin-antitoxin system HicB family antitoxin [Ruminococcus sp.]